MSASIGIIAGMGNTFRALLAAFLTAVIAPLFNAQAPAKDALPQDVREAFEWYDTLGYPRTSALQWVGVLPGEEVPSYDPRDEKPARAPTRAFLISDDDKRFTVMMPDLRQRTFKKEIITLYPTLPAGEYEKLEAAWNRPVFPQVRVEWQKESFEQDARALLALGRKVVTALHPPPAPDPSADPNRFAPRDPFVEQNPEPGPPDPFFMALGGLGKILGDRYTDTTGGPLRPILFILAHACYERKLTALAGELCDTAVLLPNYDSTDPGGPDLLSKMQRDLGYLAIFRAVEAVGGTEFGEPWWEADSPLMQTRKQLLQRFRDFSNYYPASKYVPYAKQISSMLEIMVAEDEAHVSPTDKEMEQMTVEQQVNELIFRLRDQNGHQGIEGCDVFDDNYHEQIPGLKRNSPADRLAAIGVPAVPQLLDALDDKHLTRSVGYWRRYTFSHNILTVGDCIEGVLERISGRSFQVWNLPPAQVAAARRELINAWWKEFRAHRDENNAPK